MTHIILTGDSIFDNAPYVDVGEDVIHYIKRKTPSGWKATLLAIDGSVTPDIHDQVEKLSEFIDLGVCIYIRATRLLLLGSEQVRPKNISW